MIENTILDHRQGLPLNPFTIERTRRRTAHTQRIIGNIYTALQNLFSKTVAKKARFSRDRSTVDRTCEMSRNAARKARIKDDCNGPGLCLTRAQPPHRAFASATAYVL